MLKLTDVIEEVTIYTKYDNPISTADLNFAKKWIVEHSIKYYHPCYTLVYKNFREELESRDLVNDFTVPFLLKFVFNNRNVRINDTEELLLFIHDRTTRINYKDIGFVFFRPKIEMAGIRLTYSLYRIELKKWPYRTDCKNYPDINYRSQAHCLDSCLAQGIQKALNVTISDVLIDTSDRIDLDMPFKEYDELLVQNRQAVDEVDYYCMTICQQVDCVHEEFVPAFHDYFLENSTKIAIELMASKQPDFFIQSIAAVNLIDFLTYVLSTIGFWTGFAPLSLHSKWFSSKKKRTKIETFERRCPHSAVNCRVEFDLLKCELRELQAKISVIDQSTNDF